MPDEWYRDARWGRRTEEEFERRLRRARASRPQYLRIKALALLDHSGRKERRAARDLLPAQRGQLGEAAGYAAAALREDGTDARDFRAIRPSVTSMLMAVIRELERLARDEVRD